MIKKEPSVTSAVHPDLCKQGIYVTRPSRMSTEDSWCRSFEAVRTVTFDEVGIGFAPAVAVVGGEDADGLRVGLQGSVPDSLQLNVELIHGQRCAITVVHRQHKELQQSRAKEGERGGDICQCFM